MKKQIRLLAVGLFCLLAFMIACSFNAPPPPRGPFSKHPPEWYKSLEAILIADNFLVYQRDCGGWSKEKDMHRTLLETDKKKILTSKNKQSPATIDNGATYNQIRFLARVYDATRKERFRDGALKGIDYLLAAQYDNGGWPQVSPGAEGYPAHITFNDGAMVGAMTLLRDAAKGKAPFKFVDAARRERAAQAIDKGVECILRCQIVVDGKKAAWCAQHDEKTFAPAKARSYELPSISGGESAGIVAFLMSVDNPSTQVVEAVESAVAWFDRVKIVGKRVVRQPPEPGQRRGDRVVVDDPEAPPLWARFYEIGTNRPFFSDRDGVVKYDMSEIGRERRSGYSWYGEYGKWLLTRGYPEWRKKWTPRRNVLAPE